MCRRVLHVSAALLAFVLGFLTADGAERLPLALPPALCVFVLAEAAPDLNFKLPRDFDWHPLKVAALTLLLWIPILAVYLPLLIPHSRLGNCTPDLP